MKKVCGSVTAVHCVYDSVIGAQSVEYLFKMLKILSSNSLGWRMSKSDNSVIKFRC